ncbi:hypothetical protein Tdes44962_MAKER03456 [Teratosphaeria destructans]|uniref:Uncharacterized protein n=1 Tax=Teratosphaeria destructans TaxID=418781 RepID=A0A9W7W145_9PEZI|nr:hypothetical protein Tdes44962_MAKER03456 [Teratosphaeria destructans]
MGFVTATGPMPSAAILASHCIGRRGPWSTRGVGPPGILNRRGLSVAGTRRLALGLAAGVLKLHDTPWLPRQCNVTLFVTGVTLVVDYPFMSATVVHDPSAAAPNALQPSQPLIRDETVFALGILLIELCLRRPFDDLILPTELNSDETKNINSMHVDSTQLDSSVETQQGDAYIVILTSGRVVWMMLVFEGEM